MITLPIIYEPYYRSPKLPREASISGPTLTASEEGDITLRDAFALKSRIYDAIRIFHICFNIII